MIPQASNHLQRSNKIVFVVICKHVRCYGLAAQEAALEDEIVQRIQDQEVQAIQSAKEARELIRREQARQKKMIARFPFRVNDMIVKATTLQQLDNLIQSKWSRMYDAENIVRAMQKTALIYRSSQIISKDRNASRNPQSLSSEKQLAICSRDQVHVFLDTCCKLMSVKRVQSLTTEQLCNMLWVFTKTGFAQTSIGSEPYNFCLQQLTERSSLFQFTRSFNPFSISVLLWSMSKTNFVNRDLISALCSQSMRKASQFRGQDASLVLLSLAKMNQYNEGVFTRFLRLYQPKISEMNSQQIANVLWACQKVGHYDYEFLEELAHYLVDMGLEELIVVFKGATSILHSLAILGHRNSFLLRALQKYTVDARVMFQLDMQGMVNCLYAWSVLEQDAQRMSEVINLVNMSFQRHGEHVVNEKDRYQLYFAHLLSKTQQQHLGLDDALLKTCFQAWIAKSQITPTSLRGVEHEVSVLLQQMGHSPIHNQYTEDGVALVRLGVINEGQKVCVRVMGEHHYTRNVPRRLLGHVEAWSRLYAMYGWYSIDIPVFEWIKLHSTHEMISYLEKRLPSNEPEFKNKR